MADHNEPCGCEESQLLHEAIAMYIEKNDDAGLRNMYRGRTKKRHPVEKLRHADMPLSIDDRRQIGDYITMIETENEALRHAAPPVVDSEEIRRKARAAQALKYLLHESKTLDIGDSAAAAWSQIILSAADRKE